MLETIEEHEERKCLMVHDYMLDKVLVKIKEIIAIEKFYDINILIDADDN